MDNKITPIPEVPDALREAAQIGTLIPFIGAGASRLAGCPDWNELANATLQFFVTHGKFSHAQLDQVTHLHPRIKLSVASALQATTGIHIDFRALLHRRPRRQHDKGRRLYSYLSQLGTTFVTTNYDEWLDEELPAPSADLTADAMTIADPPPRARRVYYKPADLTAANLNKENVVIHLHGSAKDPPGMILTTPQYVHHYANDRRSTEDHPENCVLTFLEYLFKHKIVLFVGYGLAELELLEYIIVKATTTETPAQHPQHPQHFLLHGFYSHEQELMMSMRTYYRDCGVELLPFLKDQDGWGQLITVLESFSHSMPTSRPMMLQEFKDMAALLDG